MRTSGQLRFTTTPLQQVWEMSRRTRSKLQDRRAAIADRDTAAPGAGSEAPQMLLLGIVVFTAVPDSRTSGNI